MKTFPTLKLGIEYLEKVLKNKPDFLKKHSFQLKSKSMTVVNDTLIVIEEDNLIVP